MSSVSKLAKGLPREALILHESERDLEQEAKLLLKSICECFKTRKILYASQIKKIREHANLAIRQAVQAERQETAMLTAQLKDKYESYHSEHTSELRHNLESASESIKQLERQLAEAVEVNKTHSRLKENFVAERDKAVRAALKEQKDDFELEKSRLNDFIVSEQQRIREESLKNIENISESFKSQLETQRRHDEELKNMLSTERNRLETETVKLREQVMDALNQVTLEKEKSALRLKEEQRKHERELQQLRLENVQHQSKVNADVHELVQKAQVSIHAMSSVGAEFD